MIALLGVLIAFAALMGGNWLEGGQMAALLDTPAGVIVLGGTLGAVVLQTPHDRLLHACRLIGWVVVPPRPDNRASLNKLVGWSKSARKDGILGLEKALEAEPDPFLRKGLELLIDGGEPHTIRRSMEAEHVLRADNDLAAARVFRSMGGYAPTIGIIGAVLGLIHVMGNLADPSQLGRGIATAFVATIYGVGSANLVFLPVADRLVDIIHRLGDNRHMSIDGLVAIAEGEHPRTIEVQLRGYVQ